MNENQIQRIKEELGNLERYLADMEVLTLAAMKQLAQTKIMLQSVKDMLQKHEGEAE